MVALVQIDFTMSYQVLARKWRPNTFAEMAGQEHVLKALINGLDHDRLHQAYLFTGTRGVGKTTIARILAKCLNCEQGVSSTPCGECASCREIADGRFMDLIEVDAASRTGVDDMRELLDNVQYSPSRGRYKIYLIDEVHMLSKSSFAALLKTLEEPPPHVKFLFATTDPQKLPITVLSRCLQFNLKNLSPERIHQHLQFVLGEENISFEEQGIWALARAADGSMRDALSLTDQAIGHGGGKITEADVNAMLGTIDRSFAMAICQAIISGDGSQVLAAVGKMAELSPDYHLVLADMLSIWHQVAIVQTVPDALDQSVSHYAELLELAAAVSREDIQLYYQICLLGRKDLQLSPDLKSGFEMVVLRALAFRPQTNPPRKSSQTPLQTNKDQSRATKSLEDKPPENKAPENKPQGDQTAVKKSQPEPVPSAEGPAPDSKAESPLSSHQPIPAEITDFQQSISNGDGSEAKDLFSEREPLADLEPSAEQEPSATLNQQPPASRESQTPSVSEKIALQDFSPDNWVQVRKQLTIGASLGEIASHCLFAERQAQHLLFVIDSQQTSLYDAAHQQGLGHALSDYFGQPLTVEIKFGVADQETPRAVDIREKAERLAAAVDTLNNDPQVMELKQLFDAVLDESSVRPID
jgi:DNA polymerase-3 subunit gamma/tau